MTASRVWKLPESAPSPVDLAAAWTKVIENGLAAMQARPSASLAFDPTAPADRLPRESIELRMLVFF